MVATFTIQINFWIFTILSFTIFQVLSYWKFLIPNTSQNFVFFTKRIQQNVIRYHCPTNRYHRPNNVKSVFCALLYTQTEISEGVNLKYETYSTSVFPVVVSALMNFVYSNLPCFSFFSPAEYVDGTHFTPPTPEKFFINIFVTSFATGYGPFRAKGAERVCCRHKIEKHCGIFINRC